LDALLTLPNKDKVEKLNFFGNRIGEVDLPRLFSEFPNLKYLNLDYNPLSVKNLSNLTGEQLEKLVKGMKNKKIRISASKGSVLADLLEYTQQLIKKGENTEQAHKLQAILQSGSVSEQEPNKTSYIPWIIGSVAIVSLAVIVGYLIGKRKKEKEILD
jgi:Leucine-rich repeat (LRR) protein